MNDMDGTEIYNQQMLCSCFSCFKQIFDLTASLMNSLWKIFDLTIQSQNKGRVRGTRTGQDMKNSVGDEYTG